MKRRVTTETPAKRRQREMMSSARSQVLRDTAWRSLGSSPAELEAALAAEMSNPASYLGHCVRDVIRYIVRPMVNPAERVLLPVISTFARLKQTGERTYGPTPRDGPRRAPTIPMGIEHLTIDATNLMATPGGTLLAVGVKSHTLQFEVIGRPRVVVNSSKVEASRLPRGLFIVNPFDVENRDVKHIEAVRSIGETTVRVVLCNNVMARVFSRVPNPGTKITVVDMDVLTGRKLRIGSVMCTDVVANISFKPLPPGSVATDYPFLDRFELFWTDECMPCLLIQGNKLRTSSCSRNDWLVRLAWHEAGAGELLPESQLDLSLDCHAAHLQPTSLRPHPLNNQLTHCGCGSGPDNTLYLMYQRASHGVESLVVRVHSKLDGRELRQICLYERPTRGFHSYQRILVDRNGAILVPHNDKRHFTVYAPDGSGIQTNFSADLRQRNPTTLGLLTSDMRPRDLALDSFAENPPPRCYELRNSWFITPEGYAATLARRDRGLALNAALFFA